MKMKVRVRSVLRCSADTAWEAVQRIDLLRKVSEGILSMEGLDLPSPVWEQGKTYEFLIQSGKSHPFRHTVNVIQVDPNQRVYITQEESKALPYWNHHHQVSELGASQCVYTDTIVFSAGLWTPLVWVRAQILYRFRHRGWQRLLDGAGPPPFLSQTKP